MDKFGAGVAIRQETIRKVAYSDSEAVFVVEAFAELDAAAKFQLGAEIGIAVAAVIVTGAKEGGKEPIMAEVDIEQYPSADKGFLAFSRIKQEPGANVVEAESRAVVNPPHEERVEVEYRAGAGLQAYQGRFRHKPGVPGIGRKGKTGARTQQE